MTRSTGVTISFRIPLGRNSIVATTSRLSVSMTLTTPAISQETHNCLPSAVKANRLGRVSTTIALISLPAAIPACKLEGSDIIKGNGVVIPAGNIHGHMVRIEFDPARAGAGLHRRDDRIGAVENRQRAALFGCNKDQSAPFRARGRGPSEG